MSKASTLRLDGITSKKARHYKIKYGLTIAEINDLLDLSEGKCYLCARELSSRGDWVIDHDHETRIVRGILCRSCNVKLGYFNQKTPKGMSPKIWAEWLERANLYLSSAPGNYVVHRELLWRLE